MLKLDNSLLDELGLGSLPEDQKRAMLQHIYETLELRVGTNLANQMTDQQLEEFEKFIDEGGDANQAQALQWLETNLPNYKQVVNEVFEALKVEIKQMAPQLVAASAPQAPQAPAPQSPYAPPQAAPAPANDYYGQPAPAAPYAPQAPGVPAGFSAPAPVPNNGGAPTPMPAVNDFGGAGAPAPAMPGPGPMGAPMPQSMAADPQTPAGFMPLPADPVAGGQQQVVQPAPTPYDQPSMPLPGSPAPQAPYDPYNQQAPQQQPQQPAQDNQAQGQGGYQFPDQQPPAGPGNYPSQHPSR